MRQLRFPFCLITCSLITTLGLFQTTTIHASQPSIEDYPSIQAAINANPNKMVFVPAGDHEISERILINTDFSGLFGPGRVIQTNPKASILQVHNAKQVQLQNITLTRPADQAETVTEGLLALNCEDIVIDNVRVIDNRTRSGAIAIRECQNARVSNCLIKNYMRISIDDRTASPDWGYAFRCIDGSGIVVTYSTGTQLLYNRVTEELLLPTPEVKEKYQLGQFTKKNEVKGTIINQKTWDAEYVNNWHQGSAIIVTSPKTSDRTLIQGNQITNAAQGIDLHCDHVTLSNNIVNNAFIGMKAMHGSKHVLIIGNQFIKNDLWSIGLMPGASSHTAAKASNDRPATIDNSDGGSIIANNIISDFGYGHAHWIWGNGGSPFRFDTGQKPENPPLSHVLIQGNLVYDSTRDTTEGNDSSSRYEYAVRVDRDARNLIFTGNLFHPGNNGKFNVKLKPHASSLFHNPDE